MKCQRYLQVFIAGLVFANSMSAFGNGACISQGNWVNAAQIQMNSIITELRRIKDQPECQELINTVKTANSQIVTNARMDAKDEGMMNTYKQFTAMFDYIRPSRQMISTSDKEFQKAVLYSILNKSAEAAGVAYSGRSSTEPENIKNIAQSLTQKNISRVSDGVSSFLDKSESMISSSLNVGASLLSAINNSEKCLDKNPHVGVAVFGAFAHLFAALAMGDTAQRPNGDTGSRGLGGFIGSWMEFSRNRPYIKSEAKLMKTEFMNNVSCLVESTAESYCGLTDAEEMLNFMKVKNDKRYARTENELLKKTNTDFELTPLTGLMLLNRDVPKVQAWMQKILFGIDPQLKVEADMKNGFWDSYLGFVKSVNVLLGTLRQAKVQYFATSAGFSHAAKLSMVRDIKDAVNGALNGGGRSRNFGSSGEENFFNKTRPNLQFYIVGMEVLPPEIQERMKSSSNQLIDIGSLFEQWWTNNVNVPDGAYRGIFQNPDAIVHEIERRTLRVIEEAKIIANAYFAQWMVPDAMNLIAEAHKGPDISPAQAMYNVRMFLAATQRKFTQRAASLENGSETDDWNIKGVMPMIDDSIHRLDRILYELNPNSSTVHKTLKTMHEQGQAEVSKIARSKTYKENSEVFMSMLYDAAAMLISRDSFFTTRMQTIVQSDLTDIVRHSSELTQQQTDYLKILGPDIVNQLSRLFTTNPVLQRDDISLAKMMHEKNLEVMETIFSRIIFKNLLELNATLFDNFPADSLKSADSFDPAEEYSKKIGPIHYLNINIQSLRKNGPGWTQRIFGADIGKKKDDSAAKHRIRAKLCAQALSFQSRDLFIELCRGAQMQSEFVENKDEDPLSLNLNFETALASIHTQLKQKSENSLDRARTAGVCALRSFFRKNQVYYLYKKYSQQ